MSDKPSGFSDVANPFGEVDLDVEDRYVPPNNLATWEREGPLTAELTVEDDEPFTAAHLAAGSQGAVPAVQQPSTRTSTTATAASRPATLDFTTSVAPSRDISGKIGSSTSTAATVPAVPRVGAAAPDTARLLGAGAPSSAPIAPITPADGLPLEDPSSFPFYNIKRYRTYFNVDTDEVLSRIFRAVALFFKGDFFDHVGDNPDLYGPFWIASTLVFVSAAAGNTASYIAYRGSSSSSSGDAPPVEDGNVSGWYYDVDKVYASLGLFYGYVGVVGLGLWIALRWGFKAGIGLAKVWCIIGYSLAAYIPMAALCVLPMEVVRWSLVGAATLMSGAFLVLNFRAVVVEAAGAQAVPMLLIMMGLHAALGLALKMYFFHYSTA